MLISWKRWVTLIALIVFQVAGFLLFIKGFFPSKVVLPGVGKNHVHSKAVGEYNKLIFMVVDAMRSDFMFSEDSNMPFVHSLIRNGEAMGFTAFSNPPTVTLPRLKGITTGSTPNFLDAILNIADDDSSSTLGEQDSWIRQLHLQDKKIHMFGDDTWIKLFPTFFTKYEGTNSFYVSDFTEVDNNVTRHIEEELQDESWDCLILHYLGLDHIGHKGGPLSSNMPLKQLEMDGIIERIYKHVVKNEDTLFLVLGDHGMNEVGNHGGSSVGETSAALLAISSKFSANFKRELPLPRNDEFNYYTKIQQIDLVPTLATLLNFPIPKNNLGIFIEDFKQFYNPHQYVEVLLENAYQLKELLEHSFGKTFEHSELNDTNYQKISNLWHLLETLQSEELIQEFMKLAQSKLAESATNYNYQDIFVGLALFSLCSLVFISFFLRNSFKTENFVLGSLFLIGTLLVSLSSFGSSLIEEEYQVWWFLISIFIVGITLYLKPPHAIWKLILILGLLRIVRGWNNSGQKFNYTSNLKIGKFLEDHDLNLNLIIIFYFAFLFFIFQKSGYFAFNDNYQLIVFLPIFTLFSFSLMAKLITCYIEDETANANKFNSFILAIINWPKELLQVDDVKKCLNPIFILFYYVFIVVLGGRLVVGLITGEKSSIHRKTFFSDFTNIFTVLLLNQTSPKNVFIYAVFLSIRYLVSDMIKASFNKDKKNPNIFKVSLIVTIFNLLIQNFSFFSLGNTNSLSTVDLTNGFNGLSDYDLIFCGLLTFIANWAAPIFWSLSYLVILLENAPSLRVYKYDLLYYKSLIMMTFYSITGFALMLACISLRFHLFIWTVFSPKLLYFASWYIFMNLGVDLFLSFALILFY